MRRWGPALAADGRWLGGRANYGYRVRRDGDWDVAQDDPSPPQVDTLTAIACRLEGPLHEYTDLLGWPMTPSDFGPEHVRSVTTERLSIGRQPPRPPGAGLSWPSPEPPTQRGRQNVLYGLPCAETLDQSEDADLRHCAWPSYSTATSNAADGPSAVRTLSGQIR